MAYVKKKKSFKNPILKNLLKKFVLRRFWHGNNSETVYLLYQLKMSKNDPECPSYFPFFKFEIGCIIDL